MTRWRRIGWVASTTMVLTLTGRPIAASAQDMPETDADLTELGGTARLTDYDDVREPLSGPDRVGATAHTPAGGSTTAVRPYTVIDECYADRGGCPQIPDGWRTRMRYVWLDTGAVTTDSYCGYPPRPEPGEPAAPGEPVEPPPPTAAQVADALAFPTAEVTVNPDAIGVTGIETWLWWEGDDQLEVTVSLGGWTGTVTARIVAQQWVMGNGDAVTAAPERTGTSTEADPAATYTYQRRCACEITVVNTWAGTFTLTHPLAPTPYTDDLGTQDVTTTRPDDVTSVEAVIVD